MLLSFIVILLPVALLVNLLSSKITYAFQHSAELTAALKKLVSNIEQQYNVAIASEANINKLGNAITQMLPKVLGATFNTLTTIFFMYFILYFMLANARKMETAIYEYIPLRDENMHKVGKEVNTMVVSNAIGIPVIALAQGVVALIGYLIIGVKEPFFWFGVTCIAAMLPVIGAALAYVPLAIIFFANDKTWQGVAMLIFGFGVIGTVDNVLRFTLLKKIGNVHPLTTVFGVIIGLSLFGFIGLIFGPLLISLFILLLKIYSNEFIVKQRDINHPAGTAHRKN
jgi:predicted PurR-regulated permease PerM